MPYSERMSSRPNPYFIGVALPRVLSDKLFSLKWDLHKRTPGSLKPLVPHITLLHPSSLRNCHKEEMIVKIRILAEQYLPFTISLEIIDRFQDEVLYISVRSPELTLLQAELVKLLPCTDQQVYAQRTFIPHVTLLQTKLSENMDIESLDRRIDQIALLPVQFTVNSLSCFSQQQPREYSNAPLTFQ